MADRETGTGTQPSRPTPARAGVGFPLAGLLVAAWAALPPYSGPALATERRVEIADHVVPAVVILLASTVALVAAGRRGGRAAGVLLVCGLVVVLAGLWMVATHVPLVAQALRGTAPAGATVYHTAPGLAVLGLGLAWAGAHWAQA